MLRFEKMTVKAQEAVQSAQEIAARHENQQIEPVHVLAALVAQADGVVSPLLARLGIRAKGTPRHPLVRPRRRARAPAQFVGFRDARQSLARSARPLGPSPSFFQIAT